MRGNVIIVGSAERGRHRSGGDRGRGNQRRLDMGQTKDYEECTPNTLLYRIGLPHVPPMAIDFHTIPVNTLSFYAVYWGGIDPLRATLIPPIVRS